MAISKELLDELLSQVDNPEDLFGKDGLLKELTAHLVERVLEGELTNHLGYEKHNPAGRNSGNNRNGHGNPTIKGDNGTLEIKVPATATAASSPSSSKSARVACPPSTRRSSRSTRGV